MNRRNILAAAVLGLAWEISPVWSAPQPDAPKTVAPSTAPVAQGLESAKQAFAQKRYDDVDLALVKELGQKIPDPVALKLSLDAAMASGKMVTANQRANDLLKASAGKDLEMLLLTARTADALGDTRAAQVRYLAYARQGSAKSDALEYAFNFVLRREAYPEEYKKYVKLFGTDGRAWRIGQIQLQKLIDAADADRTLDLAGYLIDTFPQPERVAMVEQMLWGASSTYVFGKEPKDRYYKPLQEIVKHQSGDMRWIETYLSSANPVISDVQRVQVMIDAISHNKLPLSGSPTNQFVTDLRSLKNPDLQMQAAREFLKAAPYYIAADKETHYWFVRAIGESPAVFHAKEGPLVSSDAMQKYGDAYIAKYPNELGHNREIIQWVEQNYLGAPTDVPARVAFLQSHLHLLNYQQLSEFVSLSKAANVSAVVDQWAKDRDIREVVEARFQLFPQYVAVKDKAGLSAAARDYLTATPVNANVAHFMQWVLGTPLLDTNEKLAILKEAIDRQGYSDTLTQIMDGLSKDLTFWSKDPGFKALKAAYDAKPVGKDPAATAAVALAAIKADPKQPNANVLAIANGFLTTYKGPIPAGDEKLATPQDIVIQQLFATSGAGVWENPAGLGAWAEMWAPRLPLGTNWEKLANRLRELSADATLAKLIPIYTADVRAGGAAAGSPLVWRNLMNVKVGEKATTTPLSAVYDLMGPNLCAEYFTGNLRTWWDGNRPVYVTELGKALAVNGKVTDPAQIRALMSQLWSLASNNVAIPAQTAMTVWNAYVNDLATGDPAKGSTIDLDGEARMHAVLVSGKHDAEAATFLTGYLQILDKRTPQQRLDAYATLFRWTNIPADKTPTGMTPGTRRHFLATLVKPLYEQVARRDFDAQYIPAGAILEVTQAATAAVPVEKDADPKVVAATIEQKKVFMDFGRLLLAMIQDGARYDGPPSYLFGLAEAEVKEAIAAGDDKALAVAAQQYGEVLSRENLADANFTNQIAPVVKLLEDRGNDEAVYVFVSAIQHGKIPETVSRQLMLAKSKAATSIRGLIPVPITDPSYDLYLASASLGGGDEGKAWELTAPKLKLLTGNWEGFDSRYIAWTDDQMRKQKMLKDSLDFSFNILLHENELDPEIAGKVLLTQTDVYKDMENYQAARIGYEGLKNNNRYNKTEAGQKAIYRLVELHILTKDYTAAETLLERMVDADNVQKQAEAYYLYAEMAFKQAQYKEARDYLKKVRDRVSNHVEAALLEGELNIILPGGLANTEVAIGDPRLSTVVIPGRFLTLELQDPNLSVARGGSAIPVIVTTSKGGDVEHVKLLPSSSNKNLFTTRIATALGKAQKDNLTLELVGNDVVSYIIDPDFQKANDLHYPPKILEVRSDARLVASSGEILSEEEEEKRALERQLQQRQTLESRQLDVARDGHTIRPGSKIYVEVVDPDQDLTDAPDTVKVDLHTSSGEVLEGFALTETGPHTGVFRGAVPTGIPHPKVFSSDVEEGKDATSIIRPGGGDGWVSLADGRKNKWVEVDTMSSHEVTSVSLVVPHLDTVKDVALMGVLADDYETLAELPAHDNAAKGGVQIETAPDYGNDTIEQQRRHLKLAGGESVNQEAPVLIRAASPLKAQGDGTWGTMRLRGAFYIPENQPLELKYLMPYEGYMVRTHVLIDGQEVLGNFDQQTASLVSRVDLAKGPHTLEILLTDIHAKGQVVIGSRQPDGTFAALPAEWFSTQHHPELVEYLRPKGHLTMKGDVLTATFDKPVRLRKIRAVFRDFTGTGMTVKQMTITDSDGKVVVPAPVAAGAAGVLAIAPGDQIGVNYNDVKRMYGGSKLLTAGLNSSYFNGTIKLAEEVITADPNNPTSHRIEYLEAKRCRAGDQLMVVVTDYDEDTTDGRDTVDVKVTTSSGESLTLKALETYVNGENEDWNGHAGQFLAVLKFGAATKGDTIKVVPGDRISVTYVDRENTKPGIPIDRTYTVTEAGVEKPAVTVYRTSVKMVRDDSAEARARLKRIAGRENKNAVLFKPLTVARHPDYVPVGPAATQPVQQRKEIIASVDAPLLFEVAYPRRALNAGSKLEVSAVAESELQAAKKENRQPTMVKVPTYVEAIDKLAMIKGYPIELQSGMRRNALDMLKAGTFSGVIRLQIGSKGDPIDDLVTNGEFINEAQRLSDPEGLHYKVPTLLVNGSDTVHIMVKDETSGQVQDTPIRLLSDARLELLDPTYMIANEAIHIGEKFHIRVTDADHDISNERDTVTVKVKASSGSEALVTLSETLPHSGVFTAAVEPRFIHEIPSTQPTTQVSTKPTTAPSDPVLKVDFGDSVTFTYVDDLTLESNSPVTMTKVGKIMLGSDAEVVSFTKQFKDPEIAVKTRFLMAEALFEMAKEHRKIGEMAQADGEIGRGKMILDEAIRDYPHTSLAAQGEYLLANLAQELGNFQEAVGRYSNVISTWPDSEYAAGSQFKQALCFEKMGKNDQAVEEYVKLTYLYPDNALVADATIRLGNYYLKNQSFKTAGKIFASFQARNPTHRLAPQALFLAAQCAYKQADYKEATELFNKTAESYPDEKALRPEAMYWLADSATKNNDFVKAFRTFKKVTWDYPESQWAKAARGRLTEETFSRMQEQETQ